MTTAERLTQKAEEPQTPELLVIPIDIDKTRGLQFYRTFLRSDQAMKLILPDMKDVYMPVVVDGQQGLILSEGVVAHGTFFTEPKLQVDPEDPEQMIKKPVQLNPIAIGVSARLPESTVLRGLLATPSFADSPIAETSVPTHGSLLQQSIRVLDQAKGRHTIVVGEPAFFDTERPASPPASVVSALRKVVPIPDVYGCALIGPEAGQSGTFNGLGFDEETSDSGIVPFDDPEIRLQVGSRAVALSGIVTLTNNGDLIIAGPDVLLPPEEGTEPYVCCVLHTHSQPEIFTYGGQTVANFQAGMNNQPLGSTPQATVDETAVGGTRQSVGQIIATVSVPGNGEPGGLFDPSNETFAKPKRRIGNGLWT